MKRVVILLFLLWMMGCKWEYVYQDPVQCFAKGPIQCHTYLVFARETWVPLQTCHFTCVDYNQQEGP
mgnify:CR=1 FL=1